MEVTLEYLPDLLIVGIIGRLDTGSAPGFDNELAPVLADPRPRILLDLTANTYVSSAGLRSILQLVKHTAAHGGRLGVFAAQPQVMEVIEISGFPSLLDLYDDRAAALAGYSA
jgi:anti-anti-sigma factor